MLHSKFYQEPIPSIDYDPVCLKLYKKSLRIATLHTLFGDNARGIFRKVMDFLPILFSQRGLATSKILEKEKG
jgi:hypothetical protein